MVTPLTSKNARSIMVLGTASHVGKSMLTAALCRILVRRGYRVAPFKSQNMSLNSAATPEGLEIGRAQALQAEAAGIPPSVHMNPVLIKPSGRSTSQVIVHGRIWGQISAADYHLRRVAEIFPSVEESYKYLSSRHDVLVIEGAGSPAEINLKQHDIVNMRIAELANADCLLVGDIDRGGVFASLLGTIELLSADERRRIKGFIINKFRGDEALLRSGIHEIETRLSIPCLGVVSHLHNLDLDEEDSLGMPSCDETPWETESNESLDRMLRIAVIALPSLSNFTDIDALRAEPTVDLRFCRTPSSLRHADVIVLPGSKQTVEDLLWLHQSGLTGAILHHAENRLVVGICGGMQMLGHNISDPLGVESSGTVEGLKLLPIQTTMNPEKTTVLATGHILPNSLFHQTISPTRVHGYEIHVGETTYLDGSCPLVSLQRHGGSAMHPDGCVSTSEHVLGTYLHGIFDDDEFRHVFLDAARQFHRLTPMQKRVHRKAARLQSLDRLTDHVEASLKMATIVGWLELPSSEQEASVIAHSAGAI